MTSLTRYGIGGLVWAGIAYGVLSLRDLPGDYSHRFCGPWGCLPPLQAVAAMHGFWILVVVPPSAWAIRAAQPRTLRAIGWSLTTLGIGGIGIVLAWESWTWTHRYGAGWADHLPQRLLAATITTTDVPLLQCLAVGVVLSVTGRRVDRHRQDDRHIPRLYGHPGLRSENAATQGESKEAEVSVGLTRHSKRVSSDP